jgi:glycosyltransferase involved in cell wall biosynthesis
MCRYAGGVVVTAAAPGLPQRVLLFGPPYGQSIPHGAGGGTGGYTRNMEVYEHHLTSDEFELIPLFHTVRGQDKGLKARFAVRFVIDFFRIVRAFLRDRPDAVHCLARYHEALPREALLAVLCRVFRKPFVYDIKAPLFIDAYRTRGRIYRFLADRIISSAAAVLAEGAIYLPFLKSQFGRDGILFPNFVPDAEVPQTIVPRLTGDPLRVLFVGFCHPNKGVIEVFDGCRQFAIQGGAVQLTIIGAETPEFIAHTNSSSPITGFVYRWLGRRPHNEVRAALDTHDVFCLPSKSEGHSNAVNEAMMSGMVVACSKVGLLEPVVEERGGYFIEDLSADGVAATLATIRRDPSEARRRGRFAQDKVRREYTANVARSRITRVYRDILRKSRRK